MSELQSPLERYNQLIKDYELAMAEMRVDAYKAVLQALVDTGIDKLKLEKPVIIGNIKVYAIRWVVGTLLMDYKIYDSAGVYQYDHSEPFANVQDDVKVKLHTALCHL